MAYEEEVIILQDEKDEIQKNKSLGRKIVFALTFLWNGSSVVIRLVYEGWDSFVSKIGFLESKSEIMGFVIGAFLGLFFISFLMSLVILIIAEVIGRLAKVKKKWASIYLGTFTTIFLIWSAFGTYLFMATQDRQQDISNLSNAVITENGELDLSVIPDMNTKEGKKILEFYKYVQKDVADANKKITEYENKIINNEIFSSKEKMQEAYMELDNLITYIKNYRDTYIEKRKAKFRELLERELNMGNRFGKGSIQYELYQSKINLYKSQKVLYKFYIDNFENIGISEEGELLVGEDIYDEYEKVLKIYDIKYKESSKKIKEYINISNKKLKNLKGN